eukprot:scaffold4201_cov178-Amphora_coffeaeformis.AAC.23
MLAVTRVNVRRVAWIRQGRKLSAVPSSRLPRTLDDDFDDIFDEDDDADADESSSETYKALLSFSARASWRMTPHSLPLSLQEAQRHILDNTPLSTRKKQTLPTLNSMIDGHVALRERRERERRRIFQNKKYSKQDEKQDHEAPTLLYGPEQAVASVKHRLHPHFSMTKRVLMESTSLVPSFQPKRVLDFGTGCGSAAAASWDVFGKSLDWFHLIDASKTMREVSETLLKETVSYEEGDDAEKKADRSMPRITTSAHMSTDSDSAFDLCLSSFTMTELPTTSCVLSAAALMYEKLRPGGLLVVLEPGTPDGFANIRTIRNMLLDCCPDGEDACQIIAPCTHNGPCPMERNYGNRKERSMARKAFNSNANKSESGEDDEDEDDEVQGTTRLGFCSFVQTLSGGTTRRRGEKLSYLVVQKGQQDSDGKNPDKWETTNLPDHLQRRLSVDPDHSMHQQLEQEAESLRAQYLQSKDDELGLEFLRGATNRRSFGRIIQAPNKKKGHVMIDCCVERGIERHKVPKSLNAMAPGLYGVARKSRWGGFWIPTEKTAAKR